MRQTMTCQECNNTFRISSRHVGDSIACPVCRTLLRIPDRTKDVPPGDLLDQVQPPPAPDVRVAPDVERLERDASATSDADDTSRERQHDDDNTQDHGPLVSPSKKIDYENLIDMTAMVDIVFFLLIFFLVTSLKAVDSALDLPLPDASKGKGRQQASTNDQQAEQGQVTVRIDQADRITIDGAEVRGPDEVFVRLRELRTGADRPNILMVIGNGEATHGTLVSIMDSGQELGFERIRLSVLDEAESLAAQ